MNRAELMLEVLRDGKPHARREIFERAGFMLTNNAASELRAMGYDVRQSREQVDGVTVYSYQLHFPARFYGSLSEGGVGDLAVTGSALGSTGQSSWPREGAGTELSPSGALTSSERTAPLPVRPSESEPGSLPEPALSASPPGDAHDPECGRAGSENEYEQLSIEAA